ncbi:translation factor SUA5 [Natronincola peptidivorans]|uniref:Threonylcarbamoyl-AMP synthase n=1 Tax=Natronincola peptidivorans TaxID=426128 RepID=A0A1H9ZLL8_9FIRM|nr:L-threonylcarbamoyladenylate synthase [Natronincola peptidivorans]SES82571.1 translation factor SUA5 [Natronincola peptidivorans]
MKNTMIIEIDCDRMDEKKLIIAAKILREGGTVAFPTETVYGLGANALEAEAVKKIFEAKGRPSDNPLIVHIARMEEVKSLAKELSEDALRVMEAFWPGPLTVVLNKKEVVPTVITAGLQTVAIRMPAHPIAKKLIALAEVPLAAPSANISGKPSPTRGEHVVEDLDGRVDGIIMGGSCHVGVESTVLDMTGEIPTILRPGGITREMLLQVLERVEVDGALGGDTDAIPKSPGMKYTHYAPKAAVYIVKGIEEKTVEKIKELASVYRIEGKKVGILCFDESYPQYQEGLVKSVGSRRELNLVASNLFKVLREFDGTEVDIILAEAVEEADLGQAIMNRLMKAAGYRVINAK